MDTDINGHFVSREKDGFFFHWSSVSQCIQKEFKEGICFQIISAMKIKLKLDLDWLDLLQDIGSTIFAKVTKNEIEQVFY